MGTAIIEVDDDGSSRHVQVLAHQEGHFLDKEFRTAWPSHLLQSLADLKKEWFLDSYARFEHPNYIQKQIDQVLAIYGISLPGRRILDFGCGFGASSYCLMKRGADDIVAADLVRENTDLARLVFSGFGLDRKVEIRQEDVIPTLERNAFDIVWLQAVMEHLLPGERQTYLRRFWETLRPGGWLVVTETPNRAWPYEKHTTGGRWFLPWMRPESVFRKMRKEERYRSYSDVDFYRSGIIGSTYGEIMDCLGHPPDCEELARGVHGYIDRLYEDARVKSPRRRALVSALSLAERGVRAFKRKPVMAYMPFLNHLAFRKKPSDHSERSSTRS